MSIILLETIHPDAQALLKAYSDVVLLASPTDFDVVKGTPQVEAIITRGRGQIRRALIESLPDLRVIARCGVGLDNLDTQAAHERGIRVIYAPGSTTISLAEHTMMLMLALGRKLVSLATAVRQDNWEARNHYLGVELAGKTLGIVGLGDIGRRVATLAQAFDMNVIYYNRTPRQAPWQSLSLDELLTVSDVVSLHVALTPATKELIGKRELALMKPGALLINTARGGLIDPTAVLAALDAKHLAGYAADVMTVEPPPIDDRFVRHPHTLITPHVAAITDETYRKMCVYTVTNVLQVLRGEKPDPNSIF